MAKVREQRKNQELAERARKMARMIRRKAFVCSDGVFVVQGMPDLDRFVESLVGLQSGLQSGHEPPPCALGFAPGQVMRVSEPLLADLGRALQKWRKVIREKESRSARKRADVDRVNGWKAEVATYGRRLERLHALLRNVADGMPISSSYVHLDERPETLESVLSRLVRDDMESRVLRWLAEIVHWMGGETALRRFMVAPAIVASAEGARIEAVSHLRSVLETFDKMFLGSLRDGKHRGWRDTVESANAWLKPVLERDARIVAFLDIDKPRAVVQKAEHYLEFADSALRKCRDYVNSGSRKTSSRRLAGLAALCAVDRCARPIPRHLLQNDADDKRFTDFIKFLAPLAAADGYDRLLTFFEELDPFRENMRCLLPKTYLALLNAGATADDIVWSADYLGWDRERFAEAGINPGHLRRFTKRLHTLGVDCERDEIQHALDQILGSKDIGIAAAFDRWLSHLTELRMDAEAAQRVWQIFLDALNLGGCGIEYRNLLRQWTEARPMRNVLESSLDSTVAEEPRRALELLACFQRLAGEEPRITGTLQALLDASAASQTEMARLEQMEAAGVITESARLRLNKLRQGTMSAVSSEKLLRKTEELCALTAIEGLRRAVREKTAALWKAFAGDAPLASVASHY